MDLLGYFEQTVGTGVLATAAGDGVVDAALYARPHVMEDGSLAFIMNERLSYRNLQENPHAIYLFQEHGSVAAGKRLMLTRLREEGDSPKLQALRKRRPGSPADGTGKPLHLVYFRLDAVRPLVGG